MNPCKSTMTGAAEPADSSCTIIVHHHSVRHHEPGGKIGYRGALAPGTIFYTFELAARLATFCEAHFMTQPVTAPHWLERKRPMFAVYHGLPRATRDLGVVLCNSFGHEMMCAHRAYRHLANRLAEAGFPTLRIDYDGTGDSSGSDSDVDRPSSWLASIDEAVRALQRRGAKRIALVGIRFGALLAADYAKSHPVDALVLVAPPASGRAYVRELRALHSMRLGNLGDSASDAREGVQQAVGFVLNKDALQYLEKLSLTSTSKPARRVLVVARDDLPGHEPRLVRDLTASGATVTLSRAAGYAALSDGDPVKSVVPDLIWTEIVQWLSAEPSDTIGDFRLGSEPRTAGVCSRDSEPMVQEEIVDVDGMFGVLSTPLDIARRNAPLIVLHNVGANHHIGCNRLYVDLARQWASLGFSTLRFDLVGIGDTPPQGGRKENDVYSDSGIADAGRALDWLAAARGYRRFLLAGICSGAYVSYYAALADARVEGVMLMNPLTFHWCEGDSLEIRTRTTFKSTQFYRRAALQWETWKRAAKGEVHLRAIARKMAERSWISLKQWPGHWFQEDSDVAFGFRRLCSRGARVVLVCGEDDGSCDVVAEHLGRDAGKFRRNSNFRFEMISNTDHTFAPRRARRDLAERLTGYLLEGDAFGSSHRNPWIKPRGTEMLRAAFRR
jgi:pimeloyl-ACP methyl ester carboxylesterase